MNTKKGRMFYYYQKRHITLKCIVLAIVFFFAVNSVCPNQALAQSMSGLPAPGTMVSLSPAFTPAILRGIRVYPDNALKFDFIVDSGDTGLKGPELKDVSERLIKYFLTALTIPEDNLWVNLSPHEQDRIIPNSLAVTDMGIDMLSQDYLLKQITASLIYPEDELGKQFWQKIYKKAYEQYGTTNIPVDTFNKVWIMPDKAEVYVKDDRAFVVESKLKVMLEEDYVALQSNAEFEANARGVAQSSNANKKTDNKLASEIVREIIIPALEKEVNEGKNFAQLRQIYNSLILAYWFKNNLKESIVNRVYSDQQKVKGVDVENVSQDIYKQYLKSFEKGVCDFIKVEYDQYTRKNIPRKYFSGGVVGRLELGENVTFIEADSHRGRRAGSNLVTNLKIATISIVTIGLNSLRQGAIGQWQDMQDLGLINQVKDRSSFGAVKIASISLKKIKKAFGSRMAFYVVSLGIILASVFFQGCVSDHGSDRDNRIEQNKGNDERRKKQKEFKERAEQNKSISISSSERLFDFPDQSLPEKQRSIKAFAEDYLWMAPGTDSLQAFMDRWPYQALSQKSILDKIQIISKFVKSDLGFRYPSNSSYYTNDLKNGRDVTRISQSKLAVCTGFTLLGFFFGNYLGVSNQPYMVWVASEGDWGHEMNIAFDKNTGKAIIWDMATDAEQSIVSKPFNLYDFYKVKTNRDGSKELILKRGKRLTFEKEGNIAWEGDLATRYARIKLSYAGNDDQIRKTVSYHFDNIQNIYNKGIKAYNRQDFKTAQNLFEQVIPQAKILAEEYRNNKIVKANFENPGESAKFFSTMSQDAQDLVDEIKGFKNQSASGGVQNESAGNEKPKVSGAAYIDQTNQEIQNLFDDAGKDFSNKKYNDAIRKYNDAKALAVQLRDNLRDNRNLLKGKISNIDEIIKTLNKNIKTAQDNIDVARQSARSTSQVEKTYFWDGVSSNETSSYATAASNIKLTEIQRGRPKLEYGELEEYYDKGEQDKPFMIYADEKGRGFNFKSGKVAASFPLPGARFFGQQTYLKLGSEILGTSPSAVGIRYVVSNKQDFVEFTAYAGDKGKLKVKKKEIIRLLPKGEGDEWEFIKFRNEKTSDVMKALSVKLDEVSESIRVRQENGEDSQ